MVFYEELQYTYIHRESIPMSVESVYNCSPVLFWSSKLVKCTNYWFFSTTWGKQRIIVIFWRKHFLILMFSINLDFIKNIPARFINFTFLMKEHFVFTENLLQDTPHAGWWEMIASVVMLLMLMEGNQHHTPLV